MNIRPYRPADRDEWIRMRVALWPDEMRDADLDVEADAWLTRPDSVVLVAERPGGGVAGFAELGERVYAEGCTTSPVAFLEGWYVDADVRRQRVGAELVRAAEAWARGRGYKEMGSNTQLENVDSQRAHAALGFEEVERLVEFRKSL